MSTNQPCIAAIKLWQAIPLKKLFDDALKLDFSYFPVSYIEHARRQNSLARLVNATMKQDRILLGLWLDRLLIGYSIAKISPQQRAYIFWLYVSPQFRGQGYGRQLLDSSIKILDDRSVNRVELITHNRKNFYLASNFVVDRLVKNFIDNVDVYMMSRELS